MKMNTRNPLDTYNYQPTCKHQDYISSYLDVHYITITNNKVLGFMRLQVDYL